MHALFVFANRQLSPGRLPEIIPPLSHLFDDEKGLKCVQVGNSGTLSPHHLSEWSSYPAFVKPFSLDFHSCDTMPIDRGRAADLNEINENEIVPYAHDAGE